MVQRRKSVGHFNTYYTMKHLLAVLGLVGALSVSGADYVVYEGKNGAGAGKHVVLLAGDEEYRSEEAMPLLGKILSQDHGFKCTVLFSVDAEGFISPTNQPSLTGAEALDSADAIVMLLRFRRWPDDVMKHFVGAFERGVPIVALRTSTHAFDFKQGSYKKFAWSNREWPGGFGKQVLGETWVNHWGSHKKEATRGIIEPGAASDPVLRGVSDLFGTTDVYEAAPAADAKILVRGEVLQGMNASDAPAEYKKKRADKQEQGVNSPMMPVVWKREYKNDAGKVNRIVCTTMGAATDLTNEGLRRLLVNAVYWGLGMDVPAKADVTIPGGEFHPTMYGFGGNQKGLKPADFTLDAAIPPKK